MSVCVTDHILVYGICLAEPLVSIFLRGGSLYTWGGVMVSFKKKFVEQIVQKQFVLTTHENKLKSSANRWNV